MSLESFYGGRQGISPVIKGHFSTLFALQTKFSNPEYTDVWYGEYAIISPDDNSKTVDQANYGKLYRRTYSTPYYEYVGCLKGPAGIGLNAINLSTLSELRTEFDSIENKSSSNISLSGTYNGDKKLQYKEKGKSDNVVILEPYPKFTAANKNDNIRYAWYNYTDSNNQNSIINIGFDIPSFSLGFNEVTLKEWYETPFIITDSDNSGNFYWEFKAGIPKGKPGDYINNLRIAQVSEFIEDDNTVTLCKWGQTDPLSLTTNTDDIKILDNDSLKLYENEYIWVYTYNIYNDNNSNILSKNYYVDRIKLIDNIQLTTDGKLQLKYEGEDNYNDLGTIRSIEEIINTNILNKYDIIYNDNTSDSISLPYIKSVDQEIETENNISKNYLKFEQEFDGPELRIEFSYPKEIKFDDTTQKLSVKYSNNSEEDLTTLNYIKELALNEENGEIIATHSDETDETVGTLKYPTNITFNESTGELAVKYSSVNNPETLTTIKYVKEIKLDPKTQILYAKYSTDYSPDDLDYGVENFDWEENGWTKLGLIRSTMPLSNSSQDIVSQYSGAVPVTARFDLNKLSIIDSNNDSLTIKEMLSEKIIQFLLNTNIEDNNSGFYLFKDNNNKKHIVFVHQNYDNEKSRFDALKNYGYQEAVEPSEGSTDYIPVTKPIEEDQSDFYYILYHTSNSSSDEYELISEINSNGNLIEFDSNEQCYKLNENASSENFPEADGTTRILPCYTLHIEPSIEGQDETQYLFIRWKKEKEEDQQKNPYYYGLNNLSQYNFSLAGTLLSSGIEPYALFAYDYTAENNHWFIAGYLNSSTIDEDNAIVDEAEISSENNTEPSEENNTEPSEENNTEPSGENEP